MGLLAGRNDLELLRRTGVGRDINRHYYSRAEIDSEKSRPVVQALLELIRFRNTHSAFNGDFKVLSTEDHVAHLEWRNGSEWARLEVDLRNAAATILFSAADDVRQFAVTTQPWKEAIQ